jgi:nicotinamide-nucleotide amidase
MKAELIIIGSEIILGEVEDANSAYLSRQLADIGIELAFRTTVGNDANNLREALTTALRRSEVIVTAGGLGPTDQDITRAVISDVTCNPLVFHEELMERIEEFFHRIRKTPSPGHEREAFIPEGAIPIQNSIGSAPGFIVKHEGRAVIALCGVPAELQQMSRFGLIPFLLEKGGVQAEIYTRMIKITGLEEPLVARVCEDLIRKTMNPVITMLTYPGEIHVRMKAYGEDRTEAESYIAGVETEIRNRFGDFIFGVDSDTLDSVVARKLASRDMDISVIETYTAGSIADRLYWSGEHVLKECRVIGRQRDTHLPRQSEKLAVLLADMVRKETGSAIGLSAVSETAAGVESTDLWVAVSSRDKKIVTAYLMAQSPDVNKAKAVSFALDQVRRFLG